MAGAKAEGEAPEIGVGMLGYAFMGKAHSNAYKKIPYMMYPPPAIPALAAICGRNEEAVAEAAQRYGYESYYTDWREMLDDDDVQLFDNGGPNNMHAEPCIAAAAGGQARPLREAAGPHGRRSRKRCWTPWRRRASSIWSPSTTASCPPIRQARKLIESGTLGQIYHFRAVYLQEWIMPHYDMP